MCRELRATAIATAGVVTRNCNESVACAARQSSVMSSQSCQVIQTVSASLPGVSRGFLDVVRWVWVGGVVLWVGWLEAAAS